MRNIAFVGEENKDCIASTGFFVATPNQKLFNPEFLYFILTSDYTVNGLNRYMKGDNSPSISADDLEAFALPLFSISYQNRCVSFIKKVNKMLDKINENQKGLMKLSRVLKAKVLSAVFSSDKSYYEKIPICRCFETISTLNKEVKSKDVLEKGLYPVISQGKKDIDGYSNDKTKVIFDVPAILFGDHTRCVKLLRHPFIPGADGTRILRPLIDVEYLYFAMLYSVNTFASRGYGRHFALLKKTLIPQKDLMEQNAIAARLSRLFSLISDIR